MKVERRILLPTFCANSLLLLALFLSPQAFSAKPKTDSLTQNEATLRAEIEAHSGRDFEGLIKKWESRKDQYLVGDQLLHLSGETSLSDRSRYIAIQGAARLAAKTSNPSAWVSLERLRKDNSWLVRTGVLKAFEKQDPARASLLAQELLGDSALVVRLEALATLEKIRPADTSAQRSLLKAAEDPRNWQGNRPLWIPERAIALLSKLRNKPENSASTLKAKIETLKKEML